ncbi:hypothetical protein Dsin_002737 [Dipteronia sinensis]|uniref:F-box domain-containing protein n=1 Tax=Dipteronia sinensis TaxID=43782 RepID=A0AAE0EJP6_9ROSI|nr:hypothetical protein Dsin_002737 [Dipteronia sinensis]
MYTLLMHALLVCNFHNSHLFAFNFKRRDTNKKLSSFTMMIETTMDGFDQLPDSLILLIFNAISDVKTLIQCRSVSKRFNFLVPETESLSLKVDQVISPDSDSDSLLLTFFKSFLKSLQDFLTTTTTTEAKSHHPTRTRVLNSPAQILSQFDCVKHLQLELPGGDLKLGNGLTVKWRAQFGRSLKSCVIIGFKSDKSTVSENPGDVEDIGGGLKSRVMWTISALIAASARHFMLEEIVREHHEMESLVLLDREGEGNVVMDKEGMRECRLGAAHVSENRTLVPSVRMRMRHVPRLVLECGVLVEGATLVVVRPSLEKDDVDDAELALGAFGHGIYRETVQRLLKTRSYMLEMNSF